LRISDPEYQTVLGRSEKEVCTNCYLDIVCEFDTNYGAGGSFQNKGRKAGFKKEKVIAFS
jgi:hypothetical protein